MNHIRKNEFVHKTYTHLHTIPEISYEEYKTSAYLADQLEQLGYKVTRHIDKTTVMGELESTEPGLTFALRADMDALPFEINGTTTAIHACGHDAHCAMVLGAAKYAAQNKIKHGKLVILFQEAEERMGAIATIQSGKLCKVDEMVGIHLRPAADAKLGDMTPAVLHCASYHLSATLVGSSAHAARPHLGVNALEMACAIVTLVNNIHEDPNVVYSAKVTQLASKGNSINSIPHTVDIAFDLRSETNVVIESIISKVCNIINTTAILYGGKVENLFYDGTIAPEYDQDLVKAVDTAIVEVMGVSTPKSLTTGGEDFHYFTKMLGIKTAYIGLGAGLEKGLHHPEMYFDHSALDMGVAVLEQLIDQKLNK